MNPMEMIVLSANLAFVGLVLTWASTAVKQARRRREMEHAERMKAMEMGLVPPPGGLNWPAAAVCIAVGAGVPIGSFLVSWLATLTAGAPNEIWYAPVFVSFAAIGAARKLACRVIDPKSGSCKAPGDRAPATAGKEAFDPDAFDVVGSRG